MTVGKVATSQVRPQAKAPEAAPAKPKSTASAQQAQAAGWGSGAAKATSLKITMAAIDEGPKVSDKIATPKGYTAKLNTASERLSDKVHGKPVSWESDVSNLTLSGPGGKKTAIWPETGSYASDWKSEVGAAKKEKPQEFMMLDWSAGRNLSSVGTAGKMISLQENTNDFMGGAHPNHATRTATFDASTGKQVKLDQLLTQQQMNGLVNEIAKKLDTLQGPDGITGQDFNSLGDKAALREKINENFALVADKNGKVTIDLAWDSGIHALGGAMAHFQVDAPTDPQFRSRIGAE